jgi:hypothetical protein
MLDLPELLLDVAAAADAARKRHGLEDVLVAAGMPRPRRVDREGIVARMVVSRGVTHPEDVDYLRDIVNEALTLAGH